MSYPLPLLAQAERQISSNSQRIKVRFEPPDRGTPPSQEATGTRGDCLYSRQTPPLTALVGGDRLQLTVDEYPTFWVYVPYTSEEGSSGKFSLQLEDEEVYSTDFQLPPQPGVVGISLPFNLQPLEIGKEYFWYVNINCPGSELQDLSNSSTVTGLVRRVYIYGDLKSELSQAKTPLERVATYAKHGIWYNTLTELAQLRLNQPSNLMLEQVWVELLRDPNIGLETIAGESIMGNVTSLPPTSMMP